MAKPPTIPEPRYTRGDEKSDLCTPNLAGATCYSSFYLVNKTPSDLKYLLCFPRADSKASNPPAVSEMYHYPIASAYKYNQAANDKTSFSKIMFN